MLIQHGNQAWFAERTHALMLAHPHLHQMAPTLAELTTALPGCWRDVTGQLENVGHVSQNHGINAIGLGLLPGG